MKTKAKPITLRKGHRDSRHSIQASVILFLYCFQLFIAPWFPSFTPQPNSPKASQPSPLTASFPNAQQITKDDKTEVKVFVPMKSADQWKGEAEQIEKAGKAVGTDIANTADRIGNALESLATQVPEEYREYAKTAQNYYKKLIEAGLNPDEAKAIFNSEMGQRMLAISSALESGVTAEGKKFSDLTPEEAAKALVNLDLTGGDTRFLIGEKGISISSTEEGTTFEDGVGRNGSSKKSAPVYQLTTEWDKDSRPPEKNEVLSALARIMTPPADAIVGLSQRLEPWQLDLGVQGTLSLLGGGGAKTIIVKTLKTFASNEISSSVSNEIKSVAGLDPNAPLGSRDFWVGSGIDLGVDFILQPSTSKVVGDAGSLVDGRRTLGMVSGAGDELSDASKIASNVKPVDELFPGVGGGTKSGQALGIVEKEAQVAAMSSSQIKTELSTLSKGTNHRIVKTEQELNDIFTKMSTGGKDITPPSFKAKGGTLVVLPDGTKVGKRIDSLNGGATVDITFPGSKTPQKIHISP